MGKRQVKQPPRRRARWRRVLLGVVGLMAVGGAGAWWLWEPPEASGGTPRLVVDREVRDFGYVPFETPVRAVFMLANTGDSVLRLAGVPRVEVVKGC
jgi:hypothetical protein